MIEITKYRAGTCDSCNERPAEYSIHGGREEWDAPVRPCQTCMIGLVRDNETIRAVLFLQSATRG
jgi:hypothetical protein